MAGQWANIVNFLIYLGISLPLLGIGIFCLYADYSVRGI